MNIHRLSRPDRPAYRILDNECWEWLGGRDRHGYGMRSKGYKKGSEMAHRAFYKALVGPIPEGRRWVIDHLCRTPLCVNPAHLECVTQQENVLRGKGPEAFQRVRLTTKKKLTPEQRDEIVAAVRGGEPIKEVAKRYGITPAPVYGYLVSRGYHRWGQGSVRFTKEDV